jgi:hypothetical protein
MASAGLWERLQIAGTAQCCAHFTIVTTSANADVAAMHDRMPVILEAAQCVARGVGEAGDGLALGLQAEALSGRLAHW